MGDARRRKDRSTTLALKGRAEAERLVRAGHAYFVRFPFTIHAVPEGSAPFELAIDGRQVRIYWPYVSGGGMNPKTPQADWVGAPVPPGSPPITNIWPRLDVRGAPRYSADRERYIQADALRVDVVPDPPAGEVDDLMSRFVGLLRWWTHQWWIGQDEKFLTPPSMTALAIDERGWIAGSTFNAYALPPFLGYERLLDARAFAGACSALERGVSIPYAYSSYFDATYFHGTGDRERFVMSLSIACDAAILLAVQRIADARQLDVKVYERRLDAQDQLFNLDRGLADVVGESFKSVNPEAYEALATIWRVRGRVAHGRSPTFSERGVQRHLAGEERVKAITAAGALLSWLEEKTGVSA